MAKLNVKVVPGARHDRISGRYGDGVKLQVSAPPEGGKANAAVVRLLAQALGCKPAQITVIRGQTRPRKVIDVAGVTDEALGAWLAALA